DNLRVVSSPDGVNWTDQTLVHRARQMAPALAVFQNDQVDELYLAFLTNGGSLQVVLTPDGVNWTDNVLPGGHYTKLPPAFTVFQYQLYLAYVYPDAINSLHVTSTTGWKEHRSHFAGK